MAMNNNMGEEADQGLKKARLSALVLRCRNSSVTNAFYVAGPAIGSTRVLMS